jgi:hypothetical protein
MEEDNDRPHLAHKILDPGAGLETFAFTAFLMISQPCEYSSVSTRKDWGMIVPTFIMMVSAFMVPDNRVSPYVEDPAVNEKSASKRKSLVLRRGFRSHRANPIRR